MNKKDKELIEFFRESFNEPVKPFEEWAKENNIVLNDAPAQKIKTPVKAKKWLLAIMPAMLLIIVLIPVLIVYGVFKKPGGTEGTDGIGPPKIYNATDVNAINYDISNLENFNADLFEIFQKWEENFEVLDSGSVNCDYTLDKNELVSVVLIDCILMINDECAYQVNIRIRTYKYYNFLSNELYPAPSDTVNYRSMFDSDELEKCHASYTAGSADYFLEIISFFEGGFSEQNLTEFFSVFI